MLVSLAFAIPQAITAQATLRATEDQGKNLAQQQLTERFSTAVEQLGTAENLEVRVGGIFALERIARDSAGDQPTVINVLTTFVREKTQRGPQGSCSDEPPAVDVQTALDVLAQRTPRDSDPLIDLSGRCLAHVDLKRGDLHYTSFEGADLRDADLWGMDLRAAGFGHADLRGADFGGGGYAGVAGDARYAVPTTDLTGAAFRDAELTGAGFGHAYLDNTVFDRANLTDAKFLGADLRSTHFRGANLTGAAFEGADHIDLADFTDANRSGTGLTDCRSVPYPSGEPAVLNCR